MVSTHNRLIETDYNRDDVKSQISPYGIYGTQAGTGTRFTLFRFSIVTVKPPVFDIINNLSLGDDNGSIRESSAMQS